VIAYVLAESAAPATVSGGAAVVQPSVPGGPGEALGLAGDVASGARLFATNCQVCHGVGGKGGGLPSTATWMYGRSSRRWCRCRRVWPIRMRKSSRSGWTGSLSMARCGGGYPRDGDAAVWR